MRKSIIQDFYSYGVPGYPDLPSKIFRVAIPPDVDENKIEIIPLIKEIIPVGKFIIEELPPLTTWIDGEIIYAKKAEIYSQNNYFPKNVIDFLGYSQMRKWKIINLKYTPFQYNPATKDLLFIPQVDVIINYEKRGIAAVSQIELSDETMDERAKRILMNYEEAQSWYKTAEKAAAPAAVYDYVIITTASITTASAKLNDFISFLTRKGFSPLVVTEANYGGLSGQFPNGTAEKIRQWLKDNYLAYGIEYVLLIGNPDPDDPSQSDTFGDVPMKMCWPQRHEENYKESPTDYFYADLTGNWDLDGDGYFGEYPDDIGVGGVDFLNEVYVGRIPVYSDIAALDSILTKIINYGDSTDISWRRNALLPMSFSDSSTDGAYLAEAMISNYLDSNYFSPWRMYMQGSMCSGGDSSFVSDEELVGGKTKARWESTDYGMVWWWGHGSQTVAYVGYEGCGWGTILASSDALSLDNDHPSFVYQCSCSNGYPENSNNLASALLRNGAISTVSASRVSYYAVTSWRTDLKYYCDNASIGYYYGEELVKNKKPGAQALYEIKSDMGANQYPYWGGSSWMNLFDFNLYGEPATGIFSCISGFMFSDYLDANNPQKAHTITLPEDGEVKLKIVYDTTLSVYNITIYDIDGSWPVSVYYPSSGVIYGGYGLKAGNYRLSVDRYSGYGGYTLTATYSAQTIPNDFEPNDTFAGANQISNNGDTPGHLGYAGGGNGTTDTIDYHKINLTADGEFKLKIVFDTTLSVYRITIYDIDGSWPVSVYYPSSGVIYGGYGLKAGNYYIGIERQSGYGGYSLTTNYNVQPKANDSEPNDTFAQAKLAPANGNIEGHLGYVGGGNGSTDTTDYYKIMFTASGQLQLKIVFDSTLNIYYLRIYDIYGSILYSALYPSSGVNYGPYLLNAGTYYIRIERYSGYGGYVLTTISPVQKDDFVGTWDGQGVYYRNSETLSWVKLASPASFIAAGDLDGDAKDDLIGIWPGQDGVWVRYSKTGGWVRLSSTARHIAVGDMNGDGRDDLLGTWDGQGVFYKDSLTGTWVKLASPATLITAGDLDGDGKDDLIGIWPGQGGVWVKYSSSSTWAKISSTARDIGAGDMNGDGRDDLLGTWDGQGVYYRNSFSGIWVKMSIPGDQVTAGDLDGDGTDDLIGLWMSQGGVYVKYSKSGTWSKISTSARDICSGLMRGSAWGLKGSPVASEELGLPIGGKSIGPLNLSGFVDLAIDGPGGARFTWVETQNLEPQVNMALSIRPGPGEPGFRSLVQDNLVPHERANKERTNIDNDSPPLRKNSNQ